MADLAGLRNRYLKAVLAGDRREALRLIIDDGVRQGVSVAEVRRDVVQASQHEIGRLWEENTIGVADEHMATAISQLALAHLYNQAAPAQANGKTVVVACVPGELHDFPARLVADALDLEGFRVLFLGANCPSDALLKAVERDKPDLIALSVTINFNLPGLRDVVGRLKGSEVRDIPVIVGGSACEDPNLASVLHVAGQARDAEALIRLAKQVTRLT